jgi:hypothetical protein
MMQVPKFNPPKKANPVIPTQKPWEKRRGDVERAVEAQGGYYRVFGYTGLANPGEAVFGITFAVPFISKPIFKYGLEMASGSSLVDGSFPTLCAVVSQWNRAITTDGTAELFTGCTVGVRTTGDALNRFIFHWEFTGKAIRGNG